VWTWVGTAPSLQQHLMCPPWMCPTQWKLGDMGNQDSPSSVDVHTEEGVQVEVGSRTPSPTQEELIEMFNGGPDCNNVDKNHSHDRDTASGLSMGMELKVGGEKGMAEATKLQKTTMTAHNDEDDYDLPLSQRKICLENTARAPYRIPRIPASSRCSCQAELKETNSRCPEVKHKAEKHVTWCSRLEVVHFFVGELKHEAKRAQNKKIWQIKRTSNLPEQSTHTHAGGSFVPLSHNSQVGMLNSIKKRPKLLAAAIMAR